MKNILIPAAIIGAGLLIYTQFNKKNDNHESIIDKKNAIINFVNAQIQEPVKTILVNAVNKFTQAELDSFYDFYIISEGECNYSKNKNCSSEIDAIFLKYGLNKYFQG